MNLSIYSFITAYYCKAFIQVIIHLIIIMHNANNISNIILLKGFNVKLSFYSAIEGLPLVVWRLVLNSLRPPYYKAVVYFLWFTHKVITPMITKQKETNSAVHVTISTTSPQRESDQPPNGNSNFYFAMLFHRGEHAFASNI